jgi:hypothetical protein
MSWQPATSHRVDDHAYRRAAISAEWRSTSRLSAQAIGQHLFDAAPAEFAAAAIAAAGDAGPGSVDIQPAWRF